MAEIAQESLQFLNNAQGSASDRGATGLGKLKIEFLTEDDPLYILPFFEEFLQNYADEFEIVQISCAPVMGKRSRKKLLRELLALYGALGLTRLLVRAGTSRMLGLLPRHRQARRFYTIAQLCKAHGVRFQRVGNPNETEFIEQIEARAPELIVSVACPYILKEKLLSLPKLGCVNIHHAPLPRYKGMMPTFWQMYHGEKKVGVTIHYMVAKVDEGAALLQEDMEIGAGSSLDEVIRRSKRAGAHSMAKVLRQIRKQEQRPLALDNSKGSYFKFPTLDEIREFRRRGLRAI